MKLLHVDKKLKTCTLTEVKALPKTGYFWLLLERFEDFDLTDWLQQLGKTLNPRHIEDINQINHPGFYESTKDYEVLIFRSLSNRKDQSHRRIFNSTTFLIFKNLLITVYDHKNADIDKFLNLFKDEGHLPPPSPHAGVEFCLDNFIDIFLKIKQNLDERLAYWQKKLLQKRRRVEQDWTGILDFKTDIRRLKSLCEEQLDTLNNWRTGLRMQMTQQNVFHDDQLFINLNDLADHIGRIVKTTTQSQQELESLLQLYFALISNRTNDVMRLLAILTGIFLPANLITGIFGMNFTYIPTLTKPHAFALTIGSMILISSLLLGFFRWRRWV